MNPSASGLSRHEENKNEGNDGFRFALLSDPHIVSDISASQSGHNPYKALKRVLGMIHHLAVKPRFLIFMGDLAYDGSLSSYHHLKKLVMPLGIPSYFVMGNHDNRPAFRTAFYPEQNKKSEPLFYSFVYSPYHFIVLDSTQADVDWGRIDKEQLRWLEDTLQAAGTMPKVLFLHHHPVPIGITWLDKLMLLNASDLVDIIEKYQETILKVFFGHVHQCCEVLYRGMSFSGVPSTSLSFGGDINTEKFTIAESLPSFTLVDSKASCLVTRTIFVRNC